MCAIGGVLVFRGGAEARALGDIAAALNRAQAHRGPDDEGVWNDGRYCALAHRRLSIIDTSRRGRQPMQDAGGRYQIVLNGEIYNYRKLRAELERKGARFRTGTDTEVLLAAYLDAGEAVFERLDGMFALAIYDSRDKTLLLARDRAGEKPLYYALSGERIVFASELRALAGLPGMQVALDPYGLCQYLLLRYVPAPGTILDGITQLEPGTTLRVAVGGETRLRRYFAFDRVADAPPVPPAEALEAVEDALSDALLDRLTAADVPVGAFLSGGIDSSLVCAIAARRLGRSIETFCAGFGADDDETAVAARNARQLGLPHTTYRVTAGDILGAAASFGQFLDEPNGDRSCVPVLALSRELRKKVTVAVSGDGGDELFCGYGRYPHFTAQRPAADRRGPLELLESYFDGALPVFGSQATRAAFPHEYLRWRGDFLDRYAVTMLRGGWNDAQRLSTLDFHTYLPGAVLAKVDRMSMRHALEVRSPFFAPAVMQLAAALPPQLCAHDGILKPVLRALLTKYLGAETVNAPKTGFGMPGTFMQANSAAFARLFEQAREALAATAFFGARGDALRTLAEAAPRNINSLWAFIVLGLWVSASGLRL